MANELQLNIQLTAENGSFKNTFYPGSVGITQASIGAHCPIVIVSTAETVLTTGSIASTEYGLVVGRNLDAANYVTVGPATASTGPMRSFIRIKATEPFAFRLHPSTIWKWKANAASVKVQLQLYQN